MTPYNFITNFLIENQITTVLDIGANTGEWAEFIINNVPSIQVLSIEANPHCESALKNKNLNYKICCLSDSVKNVNFYVNPKFLQSTGSSYYKENTVHFTENDFLQIQTNTLDNLLQNYPVTYQYLKMDTQGSELDILNGGKEIIKMCKYIQIETANINYNNNSPLKQKVHKFLTENGFINPIKIEEHYHEKILGHEDYIYQNVRFIK